MNSKDFQTFLSYLSFHIPTIADELSKAPDGTSAVWRDHLADCTLKDAQDAIASIALGDIPRPFHWDALPAVILKSCRQREADRRETAREASADRPDRAPDVPPERIHPGFGAAFRELQATTKQRKALPPEEREAAGMAIIEKHLKIVDDPPPAGQQHKACPYCHGGGLVFVWTNETIARVIKGSANKARSTAGVACSCIRGRKYADTDWSGTAKRKLGKVANPRYDPNQFCRTDQDPARWDLERDAIQAF